MTAAVASRATHKRPSRRKAKPNGAMPKTAGPLLDRDAVLAADDTRTEQVPMPEWGGDVLVRQLPLAERDAFEQAASAEDSSNNEVMCRIVALCVCNPDGSPMFSLEEAGLLASKAPDCIMRLMKAATRVNALAERYIEELAKN